MIDRTTKEDTPDGHSWTVPDETLWVDTFSRGDKGPNWPKKPVWAATQYTRADLIPAMLAAAREEGALAMREAACVVAAYSGAKQMPSDGSYSHHEPVMGPDVAGAIRAIDPKEVLK